MKSIRWVDVLVAMVALVVGTTLRAQDTWTKVASPTTSALWGVCYGNGQFVAVGAGGTILTSPDGRTWSTQKSGTTVWLTAVTYAAPYGYVAVGDAGTILISPDAATWTAVSSGVTTRLNAVTYDSGQFTIVGESNTYVGSTDGRNWTSEQPPGFSGWLRGLVATAQGNIVVGQGGHVATKYGYQTFGTENLEAVATGGGLTIATGASGVIWQLTGARFSPVSITSGVTVSLNAAVFDGFEFVVGGDNGTILVSTDAQTWTAERTPTTFSLHAITASASALVAVGDSGTIVESDITPKPPFIRQAPQSLTEFTGNSVAFGVAATGTAPFAYQWQYNGAPLSGATNSVLVVPAVSANQEGQYAVTVTNAVGSVTSAPASLVVTTEPLPHGWVDTSFAPAIPDGSVYAILPLSDGSIVIGGDFDFTRADGTVQHGLAKLAPTGTFDPTFAPGTGVSATSGTATVTALALQPDGRILVGGNFAQIAGTAVAFLTRLTAMGAVDTTFRPTLTAAPSQVTVLSDGRILVAQGTPTLVWLNADGTVAQTSAQATVQGAPFDIQKFDVTAAGAVVAAGEDTAGGARFNADVVRLHSDGTVDAVLGTALAPGSHAYAIRVLADGTVLVVFDGYPLSATYGFPGVSYYRIDGTGSATLLAYRYTAGNSWQHTGAAYILPDGRAVIADQSSGTASYLTRFLADGTVDPTFMVGMGAAGVVHTFAPAADGGVYVGGDFSAIANYPQPRLARLHATGVNPNAPQIVSLTPSSLVVTEGDPLTITATVTGTGPLTLQWFHEKWSSQTSATSGTFTFTVPSASASTAGTYALTVTGPASTAQATTPAVVVLPNAAPVITVAPENQRVNLGRSFSLIVGTASAVGITYQWYFNGAPIVGATAMSYLLRDVTSANAGTYSVVVTNSLGSARADTTVSVVDEPMLVNVSARTLTGAGERTLIAGFVTSGATSVILRGIGPTLAQYGVADALADPELTVYDSNRTKIAYNDNWRDAPGTAGNTYQIGFPLDPWSQDAATFVSVRGVNTMEVTGKNGTSGVALAEVYEDPNDAFGKIINLSARAYVGTGDQVLIAGFILQGSGNVHLLVRGVGPTLSDFGISAPLAHPLLTVYDAQHNVIATNSDWEASPDPSAIASAATSVGAFPLKSGAHDAAVLLTLPAGTYTATISGADAGTGIATAELYEVP